MVLSNDMKKAIAFGLICGAIISILSVFGYCAEREEITTSVLNNAYIDPSGVISSNDNYQVDYAEVEPGYVYYIENTASGYKRVGLTNSVSFGSSVSSVVRLSPHEEFSFNGSVGYIYCCGTDGAADSVKFYRVKLEGLPNFIDNLAFSLSYVNLSGVFDKAVPILAISVLFGFGFYLIRRIVNKSKKAKGGV